MFMVPRLSDTPTLGQNIPRIKDIEPTWVAGVRQVFQPGLGLEVVEEGILGGGGPNPVEIRIVEPEVVRPAPFFDTEPAEAAVVDPRPVPGVQEAEPLALAPTIIKDRESTQFGMFEDRFAFVPAIPGGWERKGLRKTVKPGKVGNIEVYLGPWLRKDGKGHALRNAGPDKPLLGAIDPIGSAGEGAARESGIRF